jgi:hypothetical protein
VILVKSAVLAFAASVVLLTIPSAVGWWQAPCPNYGSFPGKSAIGLAHGMQGCYYVTPHGAGVDVTVAYAAHKSSLPDNISDARMIDQILWNRLPFPIEQVVQYPNAFAPGDAATDKIVASRPQLAAWFGARPAALNQQRDVPLTTSLRIGRIAYPLGVLAMVLAALLTTAEVLVRRSHRLGRRVFGIRRSSDVQIAQASE